MFKNWYKFDGRIGRMGFFLTFLAAIAVFILSGVLLNVIFSLTDYLPETYFAVFSWYCICALLPSYILLVAAFKRAVDAGISTTISLVALCPLFYVILAYANFEIGFALTLLEIFFIIGMGRLFFCKTTEEDDEE